MLYHTLPRLYVPVALRVQDQITLSPDHTHYLFHVLRQKAGNPLRVFNSQDGEFLGIIQEIHKKGCKILVEKLLRKPEPSPPLTLWFAPLKRQALEMMMEKCTELGVTHFQPIKTQHTVVELGNPDRLRHIITEAAEQCERMTVPDLQEIMTLEKALKTWDHALPLYWAWERQGTPLLKMIEAAKPSTLFIGPEGGFSKMEQDLLASLPFVKPISLGNTVLRAETAAIAGISTLQMAGQNG